MVISSSDRVTGCVSYEFFPMRPLPCKPQILTGDAGIVGFGGENRQCEHRSGP